MEEDLPIVMKQTTYKEMFTRSQAGLYEKAFYQERHMAEDTDDADEKSITGRHNFFPLKREIFKFEENATLL